MKQFRFLISISFLLPLGAIGIAEKVVSQPAYIESLTGKVELKRKTWSNFRPISSKATPIPLSLGDQLRRAMNATAVVACPNGKRESVLRVEEGTGLIDICRQSKAIISKGPPPLSGIAGIDDKIPYVISPRRTLLLTTTPTLRWHPVSGATEYTVQLVGAKGIIWQTKVRETQVAYSGDPVLQPGIPYTVVVHTDTRRSSQVEGNASSEFIILQATEVKAVQAEVKTILQSNFSEEVKALKLADYYSSYEIANPTDYGLSEKVAKSYRLNADAIAVLENLIKKGKRSPLLYRTLGNLYWQTGLMRPAETAYLKAIEYVQTLEDLEEWALTMIGMGELYEATQEPKQALLWYSQARTGFNLMEDQRAAALNRRIERLKKATGDVLSQ